MSLLSFLLSSLHPPRPGATVARRHPAAASACRPLERMRVTVSACEASRAREVVARCPHSHIECCLPWPADARVQLHIRHPAGQGAALRRSLQRAVPSCDWGPVNPLLEAGR